MIHKALRNIIYLLPANVGLTILTVWRFRRFFRFWLRRVIFKLFAPKSALRYLSDNTVYWVDPEKIVFAMYGDGFPPTTRNGHSEFKAPEYKGRIVGGDWDKLERRFDELEFYNSYKERARNGTAWEKLPYYKGMLELIDNGIYKWDVKSKKDLDERCRKLDGIFHDIKQNGYKTYAQLVKERDKESMFGDSGDISVNVGRDGDLIFNGGRHRLTFAKIAGIKRVPVVIRVRHSQWEDFKKEIEAENSYTPLTHIDLQSIPARHTDKRFIIIRENMGDGNSTLLDIGANLGYFCHKFEEEGFQCTAAENEPLDLYFLQKLKRAESRQFEIIPESILTLYKKQPMKYDIVLALAVFHHFLKEKADFEELKHLLHSLDMNEMFFEPHNYDEAQMKDSFVNFYPGEFVNFILENSCLSKSRLIGTSEEDRPIYKLWK